MGLGFSTGDLASPPLVRLCRRPPPAEGNRGGEALSAPQLAAAGFGCDAPPLVAYYAADGFGCYGGLRRAAAGLAVYLPPMPLKSAALFTPPCVLLPVC